jgi:hypothetical protein
MQSLHFIIDILLLQSQEPFPLPFFYAPCREALLKGRLSKVDLLVLTGLNQLLFINKHYLLFTKTNYLIEEVNCNERSPSVSVPCSLNLVIVGAVQMAQ